MATSILIIAESGSGKSTAGRNLKPEETFWVNVANKPLPFPGWKSKYPAFTTKSKETGRISAASSVKDVLAIMSFVSTKRPEIKTLIIDDKN